MHSLLKRQLKRHFGDAAEIPEQWRTFIAQVDEAYRGFDADREMLEHSLELSSQELLEANTEMRAVFQAIPDLVLRVDHQGTILDIKAGAESDLMGRGRDLVGKQIQKIPFKEAAREFAGALARVVAENSPASIEYSAVVHGQESHYEARLAPLPDKRIAVIIRNVTERKQSLRLLGSAVEQSTESVVISEANLEWPGPRFLFVNPAFTRMTGFTAAETLGQTPRLLQGPKTERSELRRMRDTLARGESYAGESTAYRKDGTEFRLERQVIPIRDSSGTITHFLGIERDITARTQTEAALRESKQLAEAASQAKSDFLANMSHEIRTPMNAIIGLSHLALQTDLSTRQRDYLTKVQGSSRHLMQIIEGILEFSKLEAGELAVETAGFELDALLRDLAGAIAPRCREKGLELVVDVAPDVPRQVIGDARRLAQVLHSLADNAVKFTDAGKVVVSARVGSSCDDGVLLHFGVQDTGSGLTEQQTARLFQSFQQVDMSITRKFGGTGLGLATARKLAELMGGEVGVHSQPGAGSTFWLTVKLGQETPSAQVPDVASIAGSRILLVEDNDINQLVACSLLQDGGFVVEVAENGQVALDLIAQTRYDLVLMDMQMPVMDGITATTMVRRMDRYRDLPIVAVTANVLPQDRQRCMAAGMNDFLAKPIEPAQLWEVLCKWIAPRGTAQASIAAAAGPEARQPLPTLPA